MAQNLYVTWLYEYPNIDLSSPILKSGRCSLRKVKLCNLHPLCQRAVVCGSILLTSKSLDYKPQLISEMSRKNSQSAHSTWAHSTPGST